MHFAIVQADDTVRQFVTAEDAQEAMAQAQDGERVVPAPDDRRPGAIYRDGAIVYPAPPIAERRAVLCAGVDAQAEALRGRFITLGAGQAMTYQRKEAEARAWTEDADPAAFPFLAGEAVATGATLGDVAASVVAAADQWALIGSAIEGVRLGAKKAINDPAASLEQIEAAAAINWASLTGATA